MQFAFFLLMYAGYGKYIFIHLACLLNYIFNCVKNISTYFLAQYAFSFFHIVYMM